MCAWKQNGNTDFNFYDAHDINNLRDYSTEETIKRKLKERMQNTKIFVTVHLDGKISFGVKGGLLNYKIIEKTTNIKGLTKLNIVDESCRRLAGLKGKRRSPWNQFNPKWLSGKKRLSINSKLSENL